MALSKIRSWFNQNVNQNTIWAYLGHKQSKSMGPRICGCIDGTCNKASCAYVSCECAHWLYVRTSKRGKANFENSIFVHFRMEVAKGSDKNPRAAPKLSPLPIKGPFPPTFQKVNNMRTFVSFLEQKYLSSSPQCLNFENNPP